MNPSSHIFEDSRETPIVHEADVVVCGAGPAGVAAALSASRNGANTVLLEVHGCLGGVWTAGALCWIIDAADKEGIMREIIEKLDARGARQPRIEGGKDFAYDVEEMKLLLEEMCLEAGIRFQFHTRVVAAQVEEGRLASVVTESKSGRQAWKARSFIDATGDGDVAALAGCGYDLGHPETGQCQPMSLLALLTGLDFQEIESMVGSSIGVTPKTLLLEEMRRGGVNPSYEAPTLFRIRDDLYALMTNHEYHVSVISAEEMTVATVRARAEVFRITQALRSLGGVWNKLRVVCTAAQIGVREGRRIHGRETVTLDDAIEGRTCEDSICRVTFGLDIHSTDPGKSKSFEHRGMKKSKPFDIPFGCLVARDVQGLLLAGRCISGDFWAHSAYRVTGNAVAMGEAAGRAAADPEWDTPK